ncbi:hypothetical protein DSO57_1033033 [Entomophthora muscae]|uniref:Uncharacterized protein n=1 Tax=Entomophthora muscae TaxID=34485 RepID=A0ACC2TBP8_9FUNG|nr:hypothetical protein DSO57_1033033 [Entomophthora muscae]
MISNLLFCLPCSLLHLPNGLFISGKAQVKSLACEGLDLHSANHTVLAPVIEEAMASSALTLEGNGSVPLQAPVIPVPVPTCTPWLLTGLALMRLNVYFPQLSPVFSLWSSLLQAATLTATPSKFSNTGARRPE